MITVTGYVIKPIALLRQGNVLVLASEWVHGLTLRHFAQSGQISIPVFLKIAIQIARVLEQLHKLHIVHMNIRPDTIVVVPSTLRGSLTGMGHSVLSMEGADKQRILTGARTSGRHASLSSFFRRDRFLSSPL